MKETRVGVPAPADLDYGIISVPQGSGVDLDLKLEAVVEGMLITGTTHAQVYGECARCLSTVEDEKSFDLQEFYSYPGSEVDEDESVIADDAIDLEEVLHDTVVLELPFTPPCNPDCLDLCQGCGFNLNDDPGHGHEAKVDPRWEKLVGIDIGGKN